MNKASEVPVVAAVIREGSLYLVCLRPSRKRHGGLWEFPGGKVQPGESLEEAAARELEEELMLSLRCTGKLLFESQDPDSPFRISFLEVVASGKPQALEHEAIRWATLGELATMALAPTDSRFVSHLLATTS